MPEAGAPIEVAIIIVTYNNAADIVDCIASVARSDDIGVAKRVLIVDNGSTDGTLDRVCEKFSRIEILELPENRGFAGGANAGWRHAAKRFPGAEYFVLLNPDTVVGTGWLGRQIDYLEANPEVAATQPKILLAKETPEAKSQINTAGNRSHFLGFGYMTGLGEQDIGQYDRARPIDFASGCAVVLRGDVLEPIGLFDDELFMYLEDAELSWKLWQTGHEVHYVPGPAVLHKYVPDAPDKHYYLLERNRWILLKTYYKWRTRVLLLPAQLAMELCQWFYALTRRKLGERWKVYKYFFKRANRKRIRANRKAWRQRRALSDREFMGDFAGMVEVPGEGDSILLIFGNRVFAVYWAIARLFIFW